MIKIAKATGICYIILVVFRWLQPETSYHSVFNPFRDEPQSLYNEVPNYVYNHELGHKEQCKRYRDKYGKWLGITVFCWQITWCCVRYGYDNSPMEIEANKYANAKNKEFYE